LDVALRCLSNVELILRSRALHVRDFSAARQSAARQRNFGMVHVPNRDGLQHHRFTGARRRHNHPRCPFPTGQSRSNTRRSCSLSSFPSSAALRIERRQVVKEDLVARNFRVFEMTASTLISAKIPLAVFRRADLAGDRIAGAR